MSVDKIETIDELLSYIKVHWHCDETKYPLMQQMSDEQKLMFVINHLVLHMSKSVGKIAAECENFDHGNDFYRVNRPELNILAAKMLINVIQFAQTLDMTSESLIAETKKILDHNG